MKEKNNEKKKKCKAIENGTCRFRSLSRPPRVVRRIFSYKKFDRDICVTLRANTFESKIPSKSFSQEYFPQMDTEIRMKTTGWTVTINEKWPSEIIFKNFTLKCIRMLRIISYIARVSRSLALDR